MDKSRFTNNPHLDSEGFVLDTSSEGQEPEAASANPQGWQEVDGVALPTITWGKPA